MGGNHTAILYDARKGPLIQVASKEDCLQRHRTTNKILPSPLPQCVRTYLKYGMNILEF